MIRGGTPAVKMLEAAGVAFAVHEFDHQPGDRHFGDAAALALGADPDRVFKTLVVTADAQQVVCIVPVSRQLSLRVIAAAVGAKRAEMCPVATAQRITGYVAGGISPFGQKRQLRTVIDETCLLFDTIYVSGGKRGFDIEIAPDVLIAMLGATTADIAAP